MKIISSTRDYLKTTISEIYKVNWPTRQQTINSTLLVIISVVLAGIIFGLIDLGLSSILNLLIQRGS